MKQSAHTFGALAMVVATAAFAQAGANDSADYAGDAQAHGLGRLVSYTVPTAMPGGEYYKAPAVPSTVRSMPAYEVTDIRVTLFRDRDIYTKAGMVAASFRRHPGLLLGNPFKSNEGVAYATFGTDDWNSTKSDYRDIAHAMALGGDPGEGRVITKAVEDEDVEMRADSGDAAAAPAIGRFQIASAETGTKLLELPEETINIPFIRKTW
jgi:hypothetical protein